MVKVQDYQLQAMSPSTCNTLMQQRTPVGWETATERQQHPARHCRPVQWSCTAKLWVGDGDSKCTCGPSTLFLQPSEARGTFVVPRASPRTEDVTAECDPDVSRPNVHLSQGQLHIQEIWFPCCIWCRGGETVLSPKGWALHEVHRETGYLKLSIAEHKKLKIPKCAHEKRLITYRGSPIRFTADFSSETLQAGKE